MNQWFSRVAHATSDAMGHWIAFVTAVLIVVSWALTGPFLHFSEGWQLTINTGTTIVTFLMVFLLQHTQSNDTRAVHIKLDELIHAIEKANDSVAGIEQKSEDTDDPQVH